MKIVLAITLTILILISSGFAAEPGLECLITVNQIDPATGADVRLFSDSATIIRGLPAVGFFLTLSADIELIEIDTLVSRFSVHLATLGATSQTYSRMFTVEYGLPARIGDIEGKNGAKYSFVITPIRSVEVDTIQCSFNNRSKGVFSINPSAHMDIYHVPNSFGDFYGANVKGLMEDLYRQFKAMCGFNLPGKYNLFLCPCELPSILWDRRFGMSLDPTRRSASVIFAREYNTVDAFAVNHLALLRNWGYAPLVLSEGLANFHSFSSFDMKRLLGENQKISLDLLLDTYQYYQSNPYLADRSSASLVKFLVVSYGLEKFKKLYMTADDLNFKQVLTETYEQSVADLEKNWLVYADTVSIVPGEFQLHAGIAESMFNYRQMFAYGNALEKGASTGMDSLRYLSMISRAAFFIGDYYVATEAQQKLARMDTTSASRLMTLGTYRQMNAYYDEAFEDFSKAMAIDSSDHLVIFNLALNNLYRGDTTAAVKLLQSLVVASTGRSPSSEARVVLAELMSGWSDESAVSLRNRYLDEAISIQAPIARAQPTATGAQLWLGMAYGLKGQYTQAYSHLGLARFLETRAFYQGLIELWLGKIFDLDGKREQALQCYSNALILPSADFVQREAREYLENPFRL